MNKTQKTTETTAAVRDMMLKMAAAAQDETTRANRELLCEYLTSPEFRTKMAEYLFETQVK